MLIANQHQPHGANCSISGGAGVEAIKEQQAQIDELKNLIMSIEENCCKNNLKSASLTTETTGIIRNIAQLDQNIPNPFNKTTQIGCFIPDGSNSTVLYIYNMQGTQLKQYNINGSGSKSLVIDENSFVPGMYLYSLVIDGKEIDTKRMILTK